MFIVIIELGTQQYTYLTPVRYSLNADVTNREGFGPENVNIVESKAIDYHVGR